MGTESATIYSFYPFLFVISAEFIIRFFLLGIAVERWHQIYLLNFKSSLIAKEIGVYPLVLSKVMMLETWPTAKKSTFELRQIYFFFRRQSMGLDELMKVSFIRFLVEKFLHDIFLIESLKGSTTSVVIYTLKPKIGRYQLWDIGEL